MKIRVRIGKIKSIRRWISEMINKINKALPIVTKKIKKTHITKTRSQSGDMITSFSEIKRRNNSMLIYMIVQIPKKKHTT